MDTILECYGKDQGNCGADIDEEAFVSELESLKKYVQLNSAEVFPNGPKNSSIQEMLSYLYETGLASVMPNVYQMYKIVCTIPSTSVEAERSFSSLRNIKSYRRCTMSESRLSGLAILSIERGLAQDIDFDQVINVFANMRARKIDL